LEFIVSHLADTQYHFPAAERVEGGEPGPNPMHRILNAANQWPEFTLLTGGSNPAVYLYQIL
jgi:hypothetical protein